VTLQVKSHSTKKHNDVMMSLMPINIANRLPLYAQVEATLVDRIVNGVLAAGNQLPSEESLIAEFGVSRTTIRTTIQNLIGRGLVEIRRGRGTFVAQPKITQELTELTSFVEDMEVLGRQATARVLDKKIIAASQIVAQQLAVQVGTPVVQILRVRLADGVPLSFDETYLPEALGRKVMADNLAAEPIFSLLEERYDTPLLEAEYQFEASTADAAAAMALGVSVGSPIFLIERTSYTVDNRPVDYEKLHYRGEHIRFRTRLARRAAVRPKGA
jgi:GntR family transcriptional regulator